MHQQHRCFPQKPHRFISKPITAGDIACAFEELAAGGGVVPLILIARALAFESDGHAAVAHLSTCISVLAARTSVILKTSLAPHVAAAAAAAAVQLAAAYHNRGRARLQFGWTDDAWEDFAVAGGVACASLPAAHRVRKVIQGTSRQAAAAAARVALVAAVAEGGDDAITTRKIKSRKE
jgi:hypothetical protein